MSEQEELMEQHRLHRKTMSERELAHLEDAIWATTTKEQRSTTGGSGRAVWLAAQLGISEHGVKLRAYLWAAGADAMPMWTQIEKHHMPLNTAARIFRSAKTEAVRRGEPVVKTLQEGLQAYEQLPVTITTTGDVVRKSMGGRRSRASTQPVEKMGIWRRIRHELAEYVDERLKDLDHVEALKLRRDFERDLQVCIDDFQNRLHQVTRTARSMATPEVGRRQVISACTTLVMDPPIPGRPVDLSLARKQRGKQARLYHPDAHGGDQRMRAQYEAVIEAYSTLEKYNNSIGSKTAKLSVIEGGKKDEEEDTNGDVHEA